MPIFSQTSKSPQNERRNKPRSTPVNHWRNLIMWLLLIIIVLAVPEAFRFFNPTLPPATSKPLMATDLEHEAIIGLNFGKNAISNLAASKISLKTHLDALKKAKYSSVQLEQINRWQTTGEALPAKPVLISFDEANRDILEFADELLATLGMNALVFIDVNKLDRKNMQLVSWHQLEQLVNTGRWEVGISGCVHNDEHDFSSAPLLAQKFVQQREQLEKHLKTAVISVNCYRPLESNGDKNMLIWQQAVKSAALKIGFTNAPLGANYRNDAETTLRRIDVPYEWSSNDFIKQLKRYTPRRSSFISHFQLNQFDDANWITNGRLSLEDSTLKIQSNLGEQGVLMRLNGTERWQDVDTEVTLKTRSSQQFWLSVRQDQNTVRPFLRLGIADNKVMLQETNGNGFTKLLATSPAPDGDITLKIRVVGFRVMAYLNGNSLLTRPIDVPDVADHGALSLALWNSQDQASLSNNTVISAQLAQISATPLEQKGIIMPANLNSVIWTTLRQQPEALSMISPRYFTWPINQLQTLPERSTSMEIFAHYHHLKLLPAVLVSDIIPTDTTALTNQALSWASDPAFHGLNIVLKNTASVNTLQTVLNDIDQRMRTINKTLMVTVLSDSLSLSSTLGNDELLSVATHIDLVSTSPALLYPVNSNAEFIEKSPEN